MLLAPHCGQPGSLSYRRAPSARGDCRCWLRTKRDYIAIHLAQCGGSCFRTMASMLMFAPPQQVCVTSLRTSIAVRECCPWKTKHIASERERDLLLTTGLCGAHGRRDHFATRARPARAVNNAHGGKHSTGFVPLSVRILPLSVHLQ